MHRGPFLSAGQCLASTCVCRRSAVPRSPEFGEEGKKNLSTTARQVPYNNGRPSYACCSRGRKVEVVWTEPPEMGTIMPPGLVKPFNVDDFTTVNRRSVLRSLCATGLIASTG